MIPSPLAVLIVDDSPVAQKRLAKLLEELGHQVVGLASDGAEAVTKYRYLVPDIVTMDITMPGVDGIAATRSIMQTFPSALVIMVSSHGQENMVLGALDAGAQGYVLKPVEKEKLRDVLQKVVNRYLQKRFRSEKDAAS